jgi:hypothetical protein
MGYSTDARISRIESRGKSCVNYTKKEYGHVSYERKRANRNVRHAIKHAMREYVIR